MGREHDINRILDMLLGAAPGGVMVSGERGVGRSRVLEGVVGRLREIGVTVHRVPVMRQGTQLPDLAGAPGKDQPVLVLDDVDLLDEVAAAAVHDLVVTEHARPLLALARDASAPDAITALIKDGVVRRVTLGPLTREACDDLVTNVVGEPVEAATARQIWSLTGGRPRLAVDLVRGLLQSAMLVPSGDAWSWARPDRLPESFLDEAIAGRLDGLAEAEQDALELLACSGPVGPEILLDAGAHPDALESLERRRVVAAHRSGSRLVVEIPDALLAMASWQRMGRLRRRNLALRLAQAWERRGRRRGDDLARWAGLVLDSGRTPPPDVAVQGARQAIVRAHYRLAERLAHSALASGAGATAAGYLAEALSSQGHSTEAESALQRAGAAGHPSIQLVRAVNLRWGLSDRETSQRLVEDVLRTPSPPQVRRAAHLQLAGFHLYDGSFREALALADQVLAAEPGASPRRSHAITIAISALHSLGRDQDAVDHAREVLDTLGGEPTARQPTLPEVGRHLLASAVVRAHLVHGDLDTAECLARGLYTGTSRLSLLSLATWASLLGETALLRGRPRTAVRLLDEARTAAQRSHTGGVTGRTVRLMAVKGLAHALTMAGQPDAARRALDDIAAEDLHSLVAIDLWTGDVAGALAVATSHTARGVEMVLQTASRARELQAWGIYIPTLHQAVRLGGESQLPAGALDGVSVQGPLLGAQRDHVAAAVSGDADALLEVAQQYEQLGAHLFAAEAAAHAARLHEAAGRAGPGRRAAALAQACAARCEDGLPQVTTLLREPTDLTPRQREVARLAARGLPSKAIAQRLVVSVRTVDNCLGQIYRKLGISNRSELTQAMGLLDADPAGGGRAAATPGARRDRLS
ncbi:MAG TPA: LuxR C-terminal-related transcriptional regulator [Kineosporiaceae bacterium]